MKIHKQADYTPDGVRGAYVMAECGNAIRIWVWDDKVKKFVGTGNCTSSWKRVNCKSCLRNKK